MPTFTVLVESHDRVDIGPDGLYQLFVQEASSGLEAAKSVAAELKLDKTVDILVMPGRTHKYTLHPKTIYVAEDKAPPAKVFK